ncbi:MAG: acyl-CoA thioesterase [Deltaproteobacteria bacterium]|nr:MAG: acyl-CoA thioesterase [Deltaproteobacteria bacterium]
MDLLEHVNNVTYFRYFENARLAYFEKLGYMEHTKKTGIGPILASTECRYKFPLTYPDTIRVGARVGELSIDRFTMHYRILSTREDRIAAEGSGDLVSYDYNIAAKAPIPEVIREGIEALEGR